jgi:hypothetical protein
VHHEAAGTALRTRRTALPAAAVATPVAALAAGATPVAAIRAAVSPVAVIPAATRTDRARWTCSPRLALIGAVGYGTQRHNESQRYAIYRWERGSVMSNMRVIGWLMWFGVSNWLARHIMVSKQRFTMGGNS